MWNEHMRRPRTPVWVWNSYYFLTILVKVVKAFPPTSLWGGFNFTNSQSRRKRLHNLHNLHIIGLNSVRLSIGI
jgi:hypothetical protein